MKLPAGSDASLNTLRMMLCVAALILFYASVAMTAALIRQKRLRAMGRFLPVIVCSYALEQCLAMLVSGKVFSETGARIIARFAALPVWIPAGGCLVLALVEALAARDVRLRREHSITGMSVKEAMDNLPAGLLYYVPGARTLLVNETMRDFCRRAVGGELISGEEFADRLRKGRLLPECRIESMGGEIVTVLGDRTAWKITEGEIPYEQYRVRMLVASDITESYRKTQELQEMQGKLTALGQRLQALNREIVDLTTEREVLDARVRLHDGLGSNLLAIRRFILEGGTEQEKAALMKSLRQSVSFLKSDREAPVRDEYELMIETAVRLGVTVAVEGDLPREEPQKHILARGIHECCTNTLRHAHGDRLTVRVTEENGRITAEYFNNGEPPSGAIEEKGGLASLRKLTEQAGGRMEICSRPGFKIRLTLPKEVEHAFPSVDC